MILLQENSMLQETPVIRKILKLSIVCKEIWHSNYKYCTGIDEDHIQNENIR